MQLRTRTPILVLILALAAPALFAQERGKVVENFFHWGTHYRVTVRNLTPGQPFSPALIVSHSDDFRLFEPGTEASAGVARIAEAGDSSVALADNAGNTAIRDLLVAGDAPFFLGSSVSADVNAGFPRFLLSIAGMLGSTNDAFYGLDSYAIPPMRVGETIELLLPAYDAGSERNSESCEFVPGPPCGGSAHDPAEAEGSIAVHNGIHGHGNLDPAILGWLNPVAKVTIERMQ
ncbi:MAG: spondin domain-containing protein [Thermoanaerobaculia bacterium]